VFIERLIGEPFEFVLRLFKRLFPAAFGFELPQNELRKVILFRLRKL